MYFTCTLHDTLSSQGMVLIPDTAFASWKTDSTWFTLYGRKYFNRNIIIAKLTLKCKKLQDYSFWPHSIYEMDNAEIYESHFSLWFISKFCDKYNEHGKKLDPEKKKKKGWGEGQNFMVNTITMFKKTLNPTPISMSSFSFNFRAPQVTSSKILLLF